MFLTKKGPSNESRPEGKGGRSEDGSSCKKWSRCVGNNNWGRCRDNNWSRGIGLDWSWGIGRGWGINSLTSVLDISNVAIAISSVGDGLGATIRKGNMVLSIGVVAITSLRGTKVGTTIKNFFLIFCSNKI